MTIKYKKTTIVISTLLILGVLGYLFFMKTMRGNSLALYIAGGWGAPTATRYACAKETDQKVKEKFLKPLNFDQESKNLLKNFWFYSYYRGCLYRNGYDFKGNAVPKSALTQKPSFAEYKNPYAGIMFNLPADSLLISDNLLDVDFDDRMFKSEFEVLSNKINLLFFSKHSDFKTFADLEKKMQNIPGTNSFITQKNALATPSGINYLQVSQADGQVGMALFTPAGNLVMLYGQNSAMPVLRQIMESLSLSEALVK